MNRKSLAAFVVCVTTNCTIFAAEPSVLDIAAVMNNGVETDVGSQIHEVQDVVILKGGETAHGDFLYICNATINWKIDREKLIPMFEHHMKSRTQMKSLTGDLGVAMGAMALKQLPEFKKGDLVKSIRFRVRIERAGDDWIATDVKMNERIPE